MSRIIFKPDTPAKVILRTYAWLDYYVGVDGRVRILPHEPAADDPKDVASIEIVAISQHGYELLPQHYRDVCDGVWFYVERVV